MRRLGLLVVATLVAGVAAGPPVTQARFTRTGTAPASLATGSIAPPTSLAATAGGGVTLTWTASGSSAATGYQLLRSSTSGSGYAVVRNVTPVSAVTTTDSPGNGTWYYVLRTYLQSWTSANSSEASVSIGSASTGYKGCTSNAADTGGDNNGYQSNPARACALDGSVARDGNSGNSTSTSCANTGKDRHRFWGYAFGLPASVGSVNGITVQLVARVNNSGGTSLICAQLSWDGGTSWTAASSAPLTNALTTITLGGATNTWGHGWTAPQLGTSSFRVRVIDVSSQTNRTFSLDYAGVQVSYTP